MSGFHAVIEDIPCLPPLIFHSPPKQKSNGTFGLFRVQDFRETGKEKKENWKWKEEKLQKEERTFFFFFFFFFLFTFHWNLFREKQAHTSKGWALGENTASKDAERSLGEKPNFGSKLGGIGWECYFWSFSEHFKSRNLQKKSSKWQKWFVVKGVFGESDRRLTKSPHFTKNVGSLGDSRDNQQKYGVIGWQQRWK